MTEVVCNIHPVVENRKQRNVCGECQACCWYFTVPDMAKPRTTPCKHQCAAGCAIHDQPRPAMCTGFRCCWLEENWEAALRPDQSRIIWQGRGCILDRWGRPHRVYDGSMLDRFAYLRRINERLRGKLVGVGHVVCVSHTEADGETKVITWKNETAFPGLRTNDVIRHIRAYLKQFDADAYAATQRFNQHLPAATR